MAPAKTEAENVRLLLSIMKHTEGKIDWNGVAKETGLYKDGKFVRQAFNSVKTKYANSASGAASPNSDTSKKATASAKTTPKSASKATPKKRGKVNDDNDTPTKKSKTAAAEEEDEGEIADDLEEEDQAIRFAVV